PRLVDVRSRPRAGPGEALTNDAEAIPYAEGPLARAAPVLLAHQRVGDRRAAADGRARRSPRAASDLRLSAFQRAFAGQPPAYRAASADPRADLRSQRPRDRREPAHVAARCGSRADRRSRRAVAGAHRARA